ncbi:hypothetical protein HK102_010800, partial [Quaeritorhiza haematococci]
AESLQPPFPFIDYPQSPLCQMYSEGSASIAVVGSGKPVASAVHVAVAVIVAVAVAVLVPSNNLCPKISSLVKSLPQILLAIALITLLPNRLALCTICLLTTLLHSSTTIFTNSLAIFSATSGVMLIFTRMALRARGSAPGLPVRAAAKAAIPAAVVNSTVTVMERERTRLAIRWPREEAAWES